MKKILRITCMIQIILAAPLAGQPGNTELMNAIKIVDQGLKLSITVLISLKRRSMTFTGITKWGI